MRHVIKREQVHVDGARAPVRSARASSTPAAPVAVPGTRVRALRLDGRVRALEITCACGEVALVELDYDAPTATTNVPSDAGAEAPPAPRSSAVQ